MPLMRPSQLVLGAWPGSQVSVGPGNRACAFCALHCCRGLDAGLEPSLDQDGFSSSGDSVCEGLDQGRGRDEAEASPHNSCCCCC